jgi:hypothetical protein
MIPGNSKASPIVAASKYAAEGARALILSTAKRHVICMLTIIQVIALLPSFLFAQQAGPSPRVSWGPPQGAISIGVLHVEDRAQTSTMLHVKSYGSHLELGAAAQFWNARTIVEADAAWFLASNRVMRPYITASGIWQSRGQLSGIGVAGGVGAEAYILRQFSLSLSLGWRSLFQWARDPLADTEATDTHGFRVTAGLSVFPFL